ncbi:MAG: hypothetical protein U0871_07150 [Gemmataceae bacterium]
MKNVQAIIDLFGGLENLKDNPISLRVPGYMPLSIEIVGKGPRGGPLISIMHTYEQNGDLMRDPDLVVELIPPVNWWLPISFQQDNLGIFQEAVMLDGDRLITHSRLVDSLKAFMTEWDRNLGEQGFVEEARRLAGGGQEAR